MKHIIAVLAACLALTAYAEESPKPTRGQLLMQQKTTTHFEAGKPTHTSRWIQISMKDGKGMGWSVQPLDYSLYKLLPSGASREPKTINSMLFDVPELRGERRKPRESLPVGIFRGQGIEHGVYPPSKSEDGRPLHGTWVVFEYPSDSGMPPDRAEDWHIIEKGPDGKITGSRPYRSIRTNSQRREVIDYWYIDTDRLHPSLFSTEILVK